MNEVETWRSHVALLRVEVHGVELEVLERKIRFLLEFKLPQTLDRITAEEIEKLCSQGLFPHGLTPDALVSRGVIFLTTELYGKTFEDNKNMILDSLRDDNVMSIGIYGMGGVGKTTMLTHVNNELVQSFVGTSVVWVTVSHKFAIHKLQDEIARKLTFSFSCNEDERIRAVELRNLLGRKKNVVLVLDDVWHYIPLREVGIPLCENGCKLILTTRFLDVCRRMDCQKKVKVNPLNEEESWELFKDKLGDDLELTPQIEDIAKALVRECDGLPLGIITMARSMKGTKDLFEWKNMLEKMKESKTGYDDMDSKVFQVLKKCYDMLKDPILQQCFLDCVLYHKGFEIERMNLIYLFIEEVLVDVMKSRKAKLDRVHAILNKLVDACLLEACDSEYIRVKMQNLVDMELRSADESSPMVRLDRLRQVLALRTEPIILDQDFAYRKDGRILKWRQEYSDVNSVEEFVVGVEKDMKKIVGILTAREEDDDRVICLHGMGGVGKTTLAKQVYHHSQVRSHFQSFAWAPVFDNLWTPVELEKRKDALVRKILMQLTQTSGEEIDGRERAEATDYMWDKLGAMEGRKCLVVLDDVWMDLKSNTTLMLFNKPGIKVLLTTRTKPSVPPPPGLDVLSHELRCLDARQSWELFEAKANFRRELIGSDECYSEMKEIADNMLEDCAGLPLAINVIGDILKTKSTVYEWREIFHTSFKMPNEIFKDVLQILSLSCKELPYELASCFDYLAHFPKDFKIKVREVCRMYATVESFRILGYRAKPYECFKLLVERSLIQVRNLDFRGEIKTLQIHNLMRYVCSSGASHFVKLVNYFQHVEDYFHCSRRMAFHLKKDVDGELLPWENGSKNVESLMCFTRLQHPSYEDVIQPILDRFRSLRLLKFENLTQGYIGNLPKEIGELIHLRFLSLKGSHVEEVPSSIGNLVNLETLDLRTKWTTKLPNVLGKLENLRCLYLAHRSHMSGDELMKLGNLRFLEILVNIPLVRCDLNELSRLCSITKLTTYFSAKWWEKIDPSSVKFLVLVQTLAVENSSRSKKIDLMSLVRSPLIEKLRVEGRIVKLPEHDHFLMLIKLTLIRTYLEDDPMTTLEKLPNLRVVVLGYNSFIGRKMVCSSSNFSKLESLSVVALVNLEDWMIEQGADTHIGALPSLGYLLIECCHGLALPYGLRHVASLKKLVIKAMPEEFKTKLDETGKDFDVVRHVAEIEFQDCESVFMEDSDNSRSGSKRARDDGD